MFEASRYSEELIVAKKHGSSGLLTELPAKASTLTF